MTAKPNPATRRPEPPGSLSGALTGVTGGHPASQRTLRSQGRRTMRKLLDAAMVVFAERGYYNARVDDIIKLARTSHGTFYLYFASKEDVLRALVAEAGEQVAALDAELGMVSPDDDGWHHLRRWLSQFSITWQRYAAVIRAWTDLVTHDPELTEQAHAAAGGVAATLARRIEEAGPLPGIEPTAGAEAVIAMMDRIHRIRQFAGEEVDESTIDTVATMVHRGLFGGTGFPGRE